MTAKADTQQIKNLELLKKLRPIDDDFMRELFRDNIPLSELVLRIITGNYDLTVISQETQHDLNSITGSRSLCLDIFARDSSGRLFDIEIQRSDTGASPKRARYHSSAIDVEALKKGQSFDELPVTYVIFITENDLRRQNRPIYRFERRDSETGEPLGDEEYIIYVNCAYNNPEDRSDLALLIHDMLCSSAEDMHFELLASRTEYYKEKPKGVSHMCKLMEEMLNEKAVETKTEMAIKLLAKGTFPSEDIAELTELPIEEIKKLADSPETVSV